MELDEFFDPIKRRVTLNVHFDDFGKDKFIREVFIERYGEKTSLRFDDGDRVPLEELGDLIASA